MSREQFASELDGGTPLGLPPETSGSRSRALISEWMHEASTPDGSAVLVRPEHKWRATSAWQKAIRRGNVPTARATVAALWRHDPKYVLYRLPIILLEDVGWGDPDLVLAGMMACGARSSVVRSLPLVSMLTERAARAVKDRTTCDLVVATDRMAMFDPEIEHLFRHPDPKVRKDVFLDRSRDPFQRMAALWSLAGTSKYPGDYVKGMFPVARHELEELVTDDLARQMWMVGSGAMRDALPIGAILTAEYRREAERKWVNDETALIPPEQVLGGYGEAAYDQFTRDGKAAIRYFLRASHPWSTWLSRHVHDWNRQKECTARFLFRVESGLVNRRLRFEPGSKLITDAPLLAAAQMYGIPAGEVEVGKRLLLEQLPMLTQARRRVLDR